jgi:MFS family permease
MVWLVYPLLAMETIMWAFFEPARTAVIPNLVKREEALVANTLSATTWSFNLAMGATAGGVVAAFLGRDAVFVLNAASFVLSAVLIARMRFTEPHSEGHGPLRLRDLVNFSPIAEGIRYVRRDPRLMVSLFAKSGLGVVGASWVLFPVLAQRVFPLVSTSLDASRAGMLSLSLLVGARGVGALIGPLLAAPWAQRSQDRLRYGILGGFALMAIGYLLLSIAPTLALACSTVALAHVGGSIVWVLSTTLLQLGTEDRFRGRVFSAELGFCMLGIGTGAFLAGQAIDHGTALSRVALGIGITGTVAGILWAFGLRAWRHAPQSVPATTD